MQTNPLHGKIPLALIKRQKVNDTISYRKVNNTISYKKVNHTISYKKVNNTISYKKVYYTYRARCICSTVAGCPAIVVSLLFPSLCCPVLVIPSFCECFYAANFATHIKCHKYQNSVNFVVNIKTSRVLPTFFEQN